MKLRTFLAVAALLPAFQANAATLTNSLGSWDWGSFDLAANGVWVISGYDNTNPAAQNFSATLWAKVNAVYDSQTAISGATLGLFGTPVYEYTAQMQFDLTAVASATSGGLNTALTVTLNTGALSMWYDTSPNGVAASGVGITDGDLLLTADATSYTGDWDIITGSTSGGTLIFQGSATYSNPAYISPDLATIVLGTTIQPLAFPTTGMPGPGGTSQSLPPGAQVYTGDPNFTVIAVPEASTALLGLLGALPLLHRRRRGI